MAMQRARATDKDVQKTRTIENPKPVKKETQTAAAVPPRGGNGGKGGRGGMPPGPKDNNKSSKYSKNMTSSKPALAKNDPSKFKGSKNGRGR